MKSVVGVTACFLMAVAFVALPGAATACSSGKPSAAHAADGASRIVLARVVEVQGPPAYPTGYHLAVIEYLKGTGDHDLRIDALVSSLCEDRIAASEGSRVVIAFDVGSPGRTLAPRQPRDQLIGGSGLRIGTSARRPDGRVPRRGDPLPARGKSELHDAG